MNSAVDDHCTRRLDPSPKLKFYARGEDKISDKFDEKLNKATTETLGLLAAHCRYIPAKNDVQYIMQNSDLKYPVNQGQETVQSATNSDPNPGISASN